MALHIQNLSIIGCGQVGTSILLAMATQGKAIPTTIFDGNAETEELVRAKFAKEGLDSSHITFKTTIAYAVSNADLIVLATPISAFETVAKEIAQHAKTDAILTDTGSAKKVAIENIRRAIDGEIHIHYVPAHPGNGSQGSGPSTAGAGNILGKNSTMFLISENGEDHNPPDYYPEGVVKNFWNDMGVTTAFITTEKHDKFFGQCSHFQHALVFSLMNMAVEQPDVIHNFKHAGTALRNLSRVAISALKEGQPSALVQMWSPIFAQNKDPILAANDRFQSHFTEFMDLVKSGDTAGLKEKLNAAKAFRDSFDDPERREIVTGEIADIREVPKFDARKKGDLSAVFTNKSVPASATNLLLPVAIAYAQLMSAKDIDPDFIAAKANPSFRDGTHPVTYNPAYIAELFNAQKDVAVKLSADFIRDVKILTTAISRNDAELIEACILNAQNMRNTMPAPRKGADVRKDFEDPQSVPA